MTGLEAMFAPQTIAVLGASLKPGKLGTAMLRALDSFPGHVLGINRRSDDGLYSSVAQAATATGHRPDLVISCVPAAVTAEALREAAMSGARAALVCAGGFAEVGGLGQQHDAQLQAVLRDTGLRLLGPNTSGFLAPGRSLRASFVPGTIAVPAGTVAVIAASGGVQHALAFALAEAGLGLRLGVGIGNGTDVTASDVLEHLAGDDEVSAVGLHVEGVSDGRRLFESVVRVTERIPVVAVVLGRGDPAVIADAARSHTGVLATSPRVARAALRQAGAVVVEDERELVDALVALSLHRLPPMAAPGVAIVSAQAGPGLLLLDGLDARGVAVPRLGGPTLTRLGELLPPMTHQANPVDTGRPSADFAGIVQAAAADPAVDLVCVYALLEPDAVDLPSVLIAAAAEAASPVLAVTAGPADEVATAIEKLSTAGIPTVRTPAAAVGAIAALTADARARWQRQQAAPPQGTMAAPVADGALDEAAAKDLLDAVGVRTPDRRVCTSEEHAQQALVDLGGPVAVKLLDPVVVHKAEIGGVALGVDSATAMTRAWDRIGAARVLVERMAESGPELLLSASRDATFGPIVVLGLGGAAAEALNDATVRLVPLSRAEAVGMVDDLAGRALLAGWRGGPRLEPDELGAVIVAVASILQADPQLAEIEINPLRLTPDLGLVALDAVVRREAPDA